MEVTNTGTSRGAVAGGLLAAAKTHYKALVALGMALGAVLVIYYSGTIEPVNQIV